MNWLRLLEGAEHRGLLEEWIVAGLTEEEQDKSRRSFWTVPVRISANLSMPL